MTHNNFLTASVAKNTAPDVAQRVSGQRSSLYPTELIDVWRSRGGTRIMQRPVLPQDACMIGELVIRLSPQSRRNRFHGAVNQLSQVDLHQMSCVDFKQHLAVVMTTFCQGSEQIIADARYVIKEGGDSAEFAVVVDDRWQGCGLGQRAMHTLIHAATAAGIRWLHGDVWAHNRPMLSLLQRLKFCCTPDRVDEDMVHAETALGQNERHANKLFFERLRLWLNSPLNHRQSGALVGGKDFYA